MSLLTDEQVAVLDGVRTHANALASSLLDAEEAGISQAVLLPELVTIMREAGLLPESFANFKMPSFFGGGKD